MFESLELYVGQRVEFDDVLNNLAALRYNHVKTVSQPGEFRKLGGIIEIYPAEFDSPVRVDFDDDKVTQIASFRIGEGKSIWQHRAVIITPNRPPKKTDVFTENIPLNNFVDIRKGDYVVHNQHGIGRFLGIEQIDHDDVTKDAFVIEYQGGDKLFVPKHDIKLIQKYVSFNKRPPRIYKLGTKEWQKVKAQIQKRIQRLAAELLHTQAVRASLKGIPFSKDGEWHKNFKDSFPFEETPDQLKAINEVREDMESPHPMDRLICGDVGYGKTEIAMRAAFKAIADNKQVGILVPTTILAEQHFLNFRDRLADFPVKVDMLSRFRSKAEQERTVKEVADGKVDVIIGTHRLLSKDIAFKDLGLIIIDEEQRFGVKSKEKLKHFRLLADVLTMTATPIPRTLHMALTGARDMSVISTPPQNRVPVKTIVAEFDEELIEKAVKRELRRKGQVFFLHNRVEDINHIATIINRLFPKANVAVGHGQMPGKELEEIMIRFLAAEIDILVCTTIIESGIDIPNANTLIVNRADHFGLADLHQLRGRVGRSEVRAYAYFLIPPGKFISEIAKARIDALKKYSGLGAGFHIAFEDLQLRGAGNILGEQQSGYIASIGFDLYCRLLKESVDQLKKAGMDKPHALKTSD